MYNQEGFIKVIQSIFFFSINYWDSILYLNEFLIKKIVKNALLSSQNCKKHFCQEIAKNVQILSKGCKKILKFHRSWKMHKLYQNIEKKCSHFINRLQKMHFSRNSEKRLNFMKKLHISRQKIAKKWGFLQEIEEKILISSNDFVKKHEFRQNKIAEKANELKFENLFLPPFPPNSGYCNFSWNLALLVCYNL